MPDENIPVDITRFILTCINTVPHLEALLLLRHEPKTAWDMKLMAQRLFITDKKAADILADLRGSGFCAEQGSIYHYGPNSSELDAMIGRLAEIYPKHIIEITNLIHSKINKQAQQFGDAFKWQSEKE